MYDLQSRWKLEGNLLRYYGLRNQPDMFKNTVKLSKKQQSIVEKLPGALTIADIRALKGLVGVQIVKAEDKKPTPTSLEDAKFCTTCIANDYMIPGLEFDAEGKCPICQSADKTKNLKSIVPVMNAFPAPKNPVSTLQSFTPGARIPHICFIIWPRC